ncbi:hypothetical protein K504DRAFT_466259 [Pleomassaria siparia CBS 279.74]|uniref:Uncharacterized protein n=1 Tax=Pleomassaria siparia CBS 279.74 TaxID=1314801 RepID=A0A6G1KEI4_9PLEO|nr:hypothetical protein K504DRAFT_466259 [Pleomassaria siparia CBS 279.74]
MASPPTDTLVPEAQYGMLPFDRFVLDHWDYGKSVEQDQQQWDDLARVWLSKDHVGRSPYWEFCFEIEHKPAEEARLPTQEQINRVLAQHQTIKERNLSWYASGSFHDPVWLRTCYASDLAPAYEEMVVHFYDEIRDKRLLLDDETIYGNFGQDWARVFLRLPTLPDTIPYLGDPEIDVESQSIANLIEPPQENSEMPLYNAALKEKSVIYVMDEEALQTKLLKVYWLDIHGNSVWYNKMLPQEANAYESRGAAGERLDEFLSKCYEDPSLREPGTLLSYE